MRPRGRPSRRSTFLPYRMLVEAVKFGFSSVGTVVDQMIRGREGTDENDRTVAQINITVVCALATWLIFIILSIELIIKWNHITGAYSFSDSGQWIVLLAAICSLVKVMWMWLVLELLPYDQ